MPRDRINNINIVSSEVLPSPEEIKVELPVSEETESAVCRYREAVRAVLDRRDERLVVVIGPCSIHDPEAALDYARRLQALAQEVGETLLLVMRVYFEKPRTTVGWKGLINDPQMDGSYRIGEGLRLARRLLLQIAELGIPCGNEALDPITPQYLSDLISWAAIGARTTESQTHREMASGLSTPVGFKNSTDGSIHAAIHALHAVSSAHAFLGINQLGQCAVFHTSGNPYGHIVLRGGDTCRNYDPVSIAECEEALREAGLPPSIMVDCSHGNSAKNPQFQEPILRSCVEQILAGNQSIIGVMLESNLGWGNQPLSPGAELRYGVSVTDACIDWATTERILYEAHDRLRRVLPRRTTR